MQAVKVTADASAFLSVLQDITARAGNRERESTIHLRLDLFNKTVALLDADADSVYKITLPARVVPTGAAKAKNLARPPAAARRAEPAAKSLGPQNEAPQVLYCRLPIKKLAPLPHLFRGAEGGLSIICRKTTLSFQNGKKQYLLPNQLVKQPDSEKMATPVSDPNPFAQKSVVRFVISELSPFCLALKKSAETALPVRVSKGVVSLATAEFATDPRLTAKSLWPRQVLLARLLQLPEHLQVQVLFAEHTPVYFSAKQEVEQSEILREIWLRTIPTTSLYISKPTTEKKPGREESAVWKNSMLVAGPEQPDLLQQQSERQGPQGSGPLPKDLLTERLPRFADANLSGTYDNSGGAESETESRMGDDFLQESASHTSFSLTPIGSASGESGLPESPDRTGRLAMTAPRAAKTEHQQSQEPAADASQAPVSKEDALALLEQLPGLTHVKKQIREIAEFAYFEKQRAKALDIPPKPISLHMSFLGNPGTGKTMVGRMVGRIFQALGLIEHGHVVEVDRQTLVGAYMGHTEANLAKFVKKAQGGILFVDEAYTLYKKDSSKDFGLTAINGLLKIMEDQRDQLVVILAGYKREMNEFFAFNPGFRERVPFHVEFPDYSDQELLDIAAFMAAEDHYALTAEAKSALLKQLQREKIDETFGNARTVRNWLEKAKIQHAVRAGAGELSAEAYTTLAAADFLLEEKAKGGETLEQLLAELEQLVGLHDVKQLVRQMIDVLAVEQKRSELGLEEAPLTFHMAFTGNPGTGKTTVARLLGRIFRAMNLLPKGHFVEVSRKDLVAGYVGQTALKTADRIKEALGGLLFVDEAYALHRRGRDDFGAEALATLIKEMEDKKGLFTVILAGYTKEMESLFQVNPGLRSRIRFELHFPDYTASELVEIVKRKAEASQYRLTEEAEEKLWRCFLQASLLAAEDFGNGRLAEKVFEQAKINLSTRIGALAAAADKEALTTLTAEDIAFEP